MRDTNAPRPVARPTGRDGSTSSRWIVTPASAREASFDLRPWATSRRFRLQLDASHAHEDAPEVRGDGRDFLEVPCLRGRLYPLGSDTIGAFTTRRGVLARMLALDPAVCVRQRGDLEAVVAFPARLLDAVAAVLKPRRRRRLDPARARDIGAGTAFAGTQARQEAPERDREAEDGSDIELRA